ncbi:hypothetical protein RA29_08120 [Tateyamaria sp. ANG-S1]|nr:hypothetical protein RA29_08120 [Tateyamaria sp. ANG-S1]
MDPGIAKDMVRTYLHFGFGAEALQLIDANGDVFEDSQILREVSEILEFGTVEQDGYLGKFLECDSDFSLWAILASQDLNAADVLNTSAAVRTLNSLPIHMRQYLAPLLSRKLLEYSDEDGASAALRSLERTAQPLPPAAEIAKAEIELKQGEVSDAQVRLRGVVETNGQQSAEALVRYVDTHFAAGRVIEQDVATLVEAYATEFKDSPLGEELRRTHVLALAKSGQFDGAFVALGDLPLNRVKDKSVDLRSAVLQVLSSDASDATFAEHAFENISRHRGAISQNAALSIANRLIDLGFFAEAEHLLSTQNDIPQTSGNRVLRAKISLGLARPFEAQAVLRGLKGEEVSRLRAKASILAGDHDQAHEILSDLGDEKSSLEAAWLSNDWRTNVASNAPVLGAAAEVASLQVDVPTELDGMLTRLQTTLQDSADARNVIEQLIATTGSDD